MNNTTISGNIASDPEIWYSPDGLARATFRMAVDRRWQDQRTGDWNEATSYFDVVAHDEMAENIALTLEVGSRVIVSGVLIQRGVPTSDDERVYGKVEIVADDVAVSLKFNALYPATEYA